MKLMSVIKSNSLYHLNIVWIKLGYSGNFMKNPKSTKPTLVLNKTNSDGFLDFNYPSDLAEAMKALNKLMNAGDEDE